MDQLTQQLAELQRQFSSLLWVIFTLAATLAIGLGMELWQSHLAASGARQLEANFQQIVGTVTEFRQIAGKYPELAALSRRLGIEPIAPNSGTPAGTTRPAPTPQPSAVPVPPKAPGAGAAPAPAPRR